MSMYVLLVVVFLSIVVAVMAFSGAVDGSNSQARLLRERLQAVETVARRGPNSEMEILRDELLSGIPALNKLLSRWPRSSWLQRLLEQADLKLRPGKFLLVSGCMGGAVSVALQGLTHSPLLGVLGFAFGLFLPLAFVYFRRRQRFRKFEAMLPQAIELLVRSTRAGHPFTAAMDMIGSELPEPIAGEFRRIHEEQRFGLPVREALLNLVERVPTLDVKFLVTALMLQRETGGNLAEILDKLAYVIRERFRILRQVRVFTAQGRMTMLLLMSLPPVLVIFLSFTNPDFMRPLFHDPLGHMLLATGIMMQVIGYFLIRHIVDIKV
jgi:tight adherence protein B